MNLFVLPRAIENCIRFLIYGFSHVYSIQVFILQVFLRILENFHYKLEIARCVGKTYSF